VLLLTGGAQDLVVGWVEPNHAPPSGGAAVEHDAHAAPTVNRTAGRAGTVGLVSLLLIALVLPVAAQAQSLSLDLGGTVGGGVGAGAASRLVQLTALLTVLSLAPSLLVMLTAFTRIVIVLSLLRSALGVQATPPNTVLIGLAMFLTLFVMQPVLDQAWTAGLLPMTQGRVETLEGLRLAAAPFHHFMTANVKAEDLRLFLDLAKLPDPDGPDMAPWRALVPAFLVGELRRGFEMGFLIYLPFLVLDTVVASVLMSLGMMMLPPNVVSLPFKLIFFVLVDGWRLTCGSLVQSFIPPT
jgi:flagellar biosynthetic protein FliP